MHNWNVLLKQSGFIVIIALIFGCNADNTSASQSTAEPLLDSRVEERVDSLLALMTLEEKIGQLNQYSGNEEMTGPGEKSGSNAARYEMIKSGMVGSMLNVVSAASTRQAQELAVNNSRLGIPMIFAYDVIHGFQTMFPIPLGETASWDPNTWRLSARVAAREAAAAGLHWTFAPMIDIGRDARWGRVMEGAGEDPFLGAAAARARVQGFQGNNLSSTSTIAACAKHFAAYGFAEAGKDYNTVDISDHTLHNIVLPPFKAAKEAGVATFMNAFNEIGGIPATASTYLQRDLLKGEWDFKGFVVSDWGSIIEMVDHGVGADTSDVAELAIKAGSDMDMESLAYESSLLDLVKEGKVPETLIDDAVRRILRVKFLLGIMDDPYKYCSEEREKTEIYTADNRAIARDVARKSIVLLKNENQLLPLNKEGQTIAVIGPLAADKDSPLGSWRAKAITNSAVSLLEGIQKAVSNDRNVTYAKGCDLAVGDRSFVNELTINENDRSGFATAVNLARRADVVVMALGEDSWQSGEGRSQVDISLAGVQQELLEAVYAANKNIVVVLMNGRPLEITWMDENVPAIVEAWHLGSEAGNAIADVLFDDYNPSGKLPMTFPRHVGQSPIYYNHKNTGRPRPKEKDQVFWSHYTDAPNTPLYPFGYGLSYTTFEYSPLQLSSHTMTMDGNIDVSVKVTNTGDRDGEEVVQLYLRDLVGSVTRPVKELKGFEKVMINAGETETITFRLSPKDLEFYNINKEWVAEPGKFKVFVGGSSESVQEAEFELK